MGTWGQKLGTRLDASPDTNRQGQMSYTEDRISISIFNMNSKSPDYPKMVVPEPRVNGL